MARYGKLVGEKSLNSPKHPVDIAVDLNAPVLGLYGAKDASIPQDTVETMRQALRAANATAEIVVYPEADHAFNADYRASYHEESAKDGWQRMLARFAQYGGKKANRPKHEKGGKCLLLIFRVTIRRTGADFAPLAPYSPARRGFPASREFSGRSPG